MRQKLFPCCKEPMSENDAFELIDGISEGTTNKEAPCPHCGKWLIIYLNIESVAVGE